MKSRSLIIASLAATAATPAIAQDAVYIEPYPRPEVPEPEPAGLPDAARAMVETAIATGDPDKVNTVIQIARHTYPAGGPELDRLEAAFKAGAAFGAAHPKATEAEIAKG